MSWLQKGNGKSGENFKITAKFFASIPAVAKAHVDFDLQITLLEIRSSGFFYSFVRLWLTTYTNSHSICKMKPSTKSAYRGHC